VSAHENLPDVMNSSTDVHPYREASSDEPTTGICVNGESRLNGYLPYPYNTVFEAAEHGWRRYTEAGPPGPARPNANQGASSLGL